MSAVSRNIDRLDTIFDHDNLVANAGLILAGTLMVRLGLEVLINRWVKTGSARPGHKILTLVAAMLAGQPISTTSTCCVPERLSGCCRSR